MKSSHVLRLTALSIFTTFSYCLFINSTTAQNRQSAPVSPVMEIEVLSPKKDSLDNPAVQVSGGQVEIPPVLMVHRYYYSGDRSFQGPMLPGGPTILVANHPKTGKRVYVPAQMMPGAPRVSYTKKGITYDYGKNAITLQFNGRRSPTVKYRSGYTMKQKVDRLLHVDKLSGCLQNAKEFSKEFAQRSKTTLVGISADVQEKSKVITVPLTNLLQVLPFGKMLFSGDMEQYYAEQAAKHRQDHAAKKAARRAKLDGTSIKTVR